MPSGSKKRKAAKKKKEQVTNNVKSSINNNHYGNDDSKSQDKRDSDGSDVGSPASIDHDHKNHHHPFDHSEGERKRAPSHVESHVTEEKSARDVKGTEKYGLDDVETTHVRIQHVEHDKSSSCSSSSDDESRAVKKKSKEDAYNHGSEKTSYGNEYKLATVKSEEVPKVAENGTHVNISTSTPPAETSNVAEKTQDSEPHDHSKNQPLVASIPPVMQRTSLLSCCGLFDVLTGSGR